MLTQRRRSRAGSPQAAAVAAELPPFRNEPPTDLREPRIAWPCVRRSRRSAPSSAADIRS